MICLIKEEKAEDEQQPLSPPNNDYYSCNWCFYCLEVPYQERVQGRIHGWLICYDSAINESHSGSPLMVCLFPPSGTSGIKSLDEKNNAKIEIKQKAEKDKNSSAYATLEVQPFDSQRIQKACHTMLGGNVSALQRKRNSSR